MFLQKELKKIRNKLILYTLILSSGVMLEQCSIKEEDSYQEEMLESNSEEDLPFIKIKKK